MNEPLKAEQDAFGHALLDYLDGRGGAELIERSDGNLDLSNSAEAYFAKPTDLQAAIADRAVGRVLDVGCGAGRYALYLQQRGREVVAIDASPLAVEVCRRRGLRDVRLLTLEQVDSSLGRFDTVIMLGNNFGLVGSYLGAKRLLKRLSKLVESGGRIVAETMDPYQTDTPEHLSYHAQNRAKGRMGGQIRMRVRYKMYRTPWFDYLFVSREELASIIQDTGWQIQEIVGDHGPGYVAILEREPDTRRRRPRRRGSVGQRGPDFG